MTATKAELRLLEKVFDAEIRGCLPYQSKASMYQVLAEKGLVEPCVKKFGTPPFVATCEGWQLTHLGRYEYCLSCGDMEDGLA